MDFWKDVIGNNNLEIKSLDDFYDAFIPAVDNENFKKAVLLYDLLPTVKGYPEDCPTDEFMIKDRFFKASTKELTKRGFNANGIKAKIRQAEIFYLSSWITEETNITESSKKSSKEINGIIKDLAEEIRKFINLCNTQTDPVIKRVAVMILKDYLSGYENIYKSYGVHTKEIFPAESPAKLLSAIKN
jgi:hypothetical protein